MNNQKPNSIELKFCLGESQEHYDEIVGLLNDSQLQKYFSITPVFSQKGRNIYHIETEKGDTTFYIEPRCENKSNLVIIGKPEAVQIVNSFIQKIGRDAQIKLKTE